MIEIIYNNIQYNVLTFFFCIFHTTTTLELEYNFVHYFKMYFCQCEIYAFMMKKITFSVYFFF